MAENDKKVSAMVATQSVTQGAFVYVAAENQTSPTGYESFKITTITYILYMIPSGAP